MKSYRIAPSLVFWFSDFIIHRKGGYAILLCFKSCKVLILLLFESFLAAKAVVKALASIEGAISPAKLTVALKTINQTTLDAIPLHYHHSQLLNFVYLSIYENQHFNVIEKYEY